MTWKQAFWRLFHIYKNWLIEQGPRDEVSGRRDYDKHYKPMREEIDQLFLQIPKE